MEKSKSQERREEIQTAAKEFDWNAIYSIQSEGLVFEGNPVVLDGKERFSIYPAHGFPAHSIPLDEAKRQSFKFVRKI